MRVKANTNFELIIDATIGRPRRNGEEFEVSEERGKLLKEHNLVSEIPDLEKMAELNKVIMAAENEIEEIKPKRGGKKKN